jgi:4-oxalomesaconate tautomerase
MSFGVRAMLMRGGTSKGLYFLADDLPSEVNQRNAFLLEAMGSPDDRQIDGVGGAHPLTSKVAVVSKSLDSDADVDYLFLQVMVDRAVVTDAQNCGNILAGVGPFAIERGLVTVANPVSSVASVSSVSSAPSVSSVDVRIRMLNTGGIAIANVQVSNGLPSYSGGVTIAGVPGTGSPIRVDFEATAGSSCGALLPTGNSVDSIQGIACTLIDNGMPVVVLRAADVGVTGYESPAELEANQALREMVERIRLAAGPLMNLGDVTDLTVPKMTLVAAPRDGGTLCTRTFIPHRCHDAIGVLGAVSVATAALLPGSPAASVCVPFDGVVVVEHPTGTFDAAIEVSYSADGALVMERAGIIRTARKLMDGQVFSREQYL